MVSIYDGQPVSEPLQIVVSASFYLELTLNAEQSRKSRRLLLRSKTKASKERILRMAVAKMRILARTEDTFVGRFNFLRRQIVF